MRVFLAVLSIFVFLHSDVSLSSDLNLTIRDDQVANLEIEKRVSNLEKKIEIGRRDIIKNIWYVRYNNYKNFQTLTAERNSLKEELSKTYKSNTKKVDILNKKITTISEQLEVLKDFEISPTVSLLQPPEIAIAPKIKNPFDIVSGYNHIKYLLNQRDDYKNKVLSLSALLDELKEQELLLEELLSYKMVGNPVKLESELLIIKEQITDFARSQEFASSALNVFEKRIDENVEDIKVEIRKQIKRAINLAIIIALVLLFAFLFKYTCKKYFRDDERLYTINKFINFTQVFLIITIVIFAYIENVTYLITVLGFASAGLAIAMKDMFMSILGWFAITFGGTLHVGDRIKVRNGPTENLVGDIIDISLLRITLYEDITLATYTESRRAGRIVFVPNNYVFTQIIANYTHSGMKTVWDGIDILLTFESNHTKAAYIIKNIARKYSKGHTDIAKKQMAKLRNRYSIKNSNIEPRIFTFFEPYGIKISVWYMTNSYATLALRSNISGDILEALRAEKDIEIAYPSQTLYRGDKKSFHYNGELKMESEA